MIQMRIQFLQFQSVFKFWDSNEDKFVNDLKALKIIVTVVQNRIEDLRNVASEYIELQNSQLAKRKLDKFDDILNLIVLEINELEVS